MKSLSLLGAVILAAVFTSAASAGISVQESRPGTVTEGGTVPTQATFSPPLSAGQSVVIEAAGTQALRLDVIDGEVSKLSSRLKMPETGSITYRQFRNGNLEDSQSITVNIRNGEKPAGTASLITKGDKNVMERAKAGSYGLLARTENGMGSIIVLHDSGFRVRITGSNALSNGLYLGVDGGFSEKLVSEFSSP